MSVDGITNVTINTETNTNKKNTTTKTEINMKDFYIYDAEGNIIGVDEAKLAAAQQQGKIAGEMQGIQMASIQIEHDSFVRAAKEDAAKKESETEEAEDIKANVVGTINDVNMYINYQNSQGFDLSSFNSEYAQDVRELQKLANELTKATASNTTVLNGSAQFIAKAQDVQEQGKSITEQLKENENTEASVNTDKYNETYNLETYETENFFTNNQFMTSAFETSDVEEEDNVFAA